MSSPKTIDPCPCESGFITKECCKKKGKWFKEPKFIYIPGETSFQHPDCYMNLLSDCSGDISREHYVSKIILEGISAKTVQIKGPTFLQGEEKTIGIANLTSKILCKYHNNSFSVLDSESGRLFERLKQIYKRNHDCSSFSIFSGHDIELWLLKTLISTFISLGNEIELSYLSKILTLEESFKYPLGFYIVDAKDMYLYQSVKTDVKITEDSKMGRFDFHLYSLPLVLVFNEDFITSDLRYRPRKIRFQTGKDFDVIELSWKEKMNTPIISFELIKQVENERPPGY